MVAKVFNTGKGSQHRCRLLPSIASSLQFVKSLEQTLDSLGNEELQNQEQLGQ
jgi:hypothetical protein